MSSSRWRGQGHVLANDVTVFRDCRMARDQSDTTPIRARDELVAWFEDGCKTGELRAGAEHEKFPFYAADKRPVPYEPMGIRALLEGLAQRTGWEPILDGDNPIGL